MADLELDLSGLDRTIGRLDSLADADFTPLMEEWERVLREETTEGLQAGIGCDGHALPTTWRERNPESQWMLSRKSRKPFRALGYLEAGDGPPLVPRTTWRFFSLMRTGSGRDGNGTWFAQMGWPGFTSDDGRYWIPGLHARPGADARYPQRDAISRPYPEAIVRAKQALQDYVRSLIRGKP